jgi:hypothetical protein
LDPQFNSFESRTVCENNSDIPKQDDIKQLYPESMQLEYEQKDRSSFSAWEISTPSEGQNHRYILNNGVHLGPQELIVVVFD